MWFTIQPSRHSTPYAIGRPKRLCSAALSRETDGGGTVDIGNGLGLGDQLLTGLSLRMICSAVWRIHFMVKSSVQSCWMRTLINMHQRPGATSPRSWHMSDLSRTLLPSRALAICSANINPP